MSTTGVLDSEADWRSEALAVIRDIGEHVTSAEVWRFAPVGDAIYLNIVTLEGRPLTVELSVGGFRIAGEGLENVDDKLRGAGPRYETPYALLNSVSDAFRRSFGTALVAKLAQLSRDEK